MKIIPLVLAIFGVLLLASCTDTTANDQSGKQYPPGAVVCTPESREGDACTMEFMPVCGNNDQTYGNKCQACQDDNVQYYLQGACSGDEESAAPPERLAFTQCSDPRPDMCTKEYNPVCGETDNGIRCIKEPCPSTDKKTYGNACTACSDATVYGYWPGACGNMPLDTGSQDFQDCAAQGNPIMESMPRKCTYSDNTIVVEQYTLCDDSGCVEVDNCPAGSDIYGSQLGPACVNHYTPQDMTGWKSCESANDCSNGYCAYTPRTTDGSPALDKNLHCIPTDYYAFLLHTSGVSGVDENGEQYTVIA